MSLAPGLCLVTGATGFVGSAVARALLRGGHPVRVLARPASDRRNLAGLPVEIAAGTMEDAASLARAVAGCRYLFHVAADYRLWVPDPAAMYRANVEGTRELMLAALAAGVERVVYTSSVATLGLVSGGSADEDTPSRLDDMIGPYKRSKFQAEEVVRGADRRAPAAGGDRQPVDAGRPRRPEADADRAARSSKPRTGHMPGYVDTGLNIVHVDDVAAGELAAAEHGPGRRALYSRRRKPVARRDPGRGRARRRPAAAAPQSALSGRVCRGGDRHRDARVTGREPFTTLDGVRMSRKKMYFSSAKAERELGYRPRPARRGHRRCRRLVRRQRLSEGLNYGVQ